MTLTRAEMDELERIIDDPREFVPRMNILDSMNSLKTLNPMWVEQKEWFEAIVSCPNVIGLKPRQVGFTTVTCLYLFYLLLTSPNAERAVQIVHENDALLRAAEIHRTAYHNLPPQLRLGLAKDNERVFRFAHNEAGFNRILAGGRGQGRSWVFNHAHATEMAKWPRSTASDTTSERGSADEEVFASVMATIHDRQNGRVIVESTGNGPTGLFYQLYLQAKRGVDSNGRKWRLVFVPWTVVPRYDLPLTDAEARALEADLDDDELRLFKNCGLRLGQIAFRREKIRVFKYSPMRFRFEYPLTDIEPFLLSSVGWFHQEALNEMLALCPAPTVELATVKIWEPYDETRKYSIGVDTAGGLGGDEACIKVFLEDNTEVAHWADCWSKPGSQAMMLARLYFMYGQPPTLIEMNKYGKDVKDAAIKLGVTNLWKDENSDDWYTSRENKRTAFIHAEELTTNGWCVLREPEAIRQMMTIVEKSNGKIEPRAEASTGADLSLEGHDDRCMAAVLGLWCGRRYSSAGPHSRTHVTRDKLVAMRRILGRVHG